MVVNRNSQMLQSQLDALASHANDVLPGHSYGPFKFIPINHTVSSAAGLLKAWICDNGYVGTNGGLCAVLDEQKVYQLTSTNYRLASSWTHRPEIIWGETAFPPASSHATGTVCYRVGLGFYVRINSVAWEKWQGVKIECNYIRLAISTDPLNPQYEVTIAGTKFVRTRSIIAPSEHRITRTDNPLTTFGRTEIAFEHESDTSPTITAAQYLSNVYRSSGGGSVTNWESSFYVDTVHPVLINGFIVFSFTGSTPPTITFSTHPLTIVQGQVQTFANLWHIPFVDVPFAGGEFLIRMTAASGSSISNGANPFSDRLNQFGAPVQGLKFTSSLPHASSMIDAIHGQKQVREIRPRLWDEIFRVYRPGTDPVRGDYYSEERDSVCRTTGAGYWKLKERFLSMVEDAEPISLTTRAVLHKSAGDTITSSDGLIHAQTAVEGAPARCYYRRNTDDPNRVVLQSYPPGVAPTGQITGGSTVAEVIVSRIEPMDGQALTVDIGYMFGPANAAAADLTFKKLVTITIDADALSSDPIYPDWTIFTAYSLTYRCAQEVNVMATIFKGNPVIDGGTTATIEGRTRASVFNQLWAGLDQMKSQP